MKFWRDEVLTQSLSSGARYPGRNELGTFLKCSPSFQRLLNSVFYRALEKGHERIAAMIYAAYPAHPGRIRNKLFISLVRNGKTSMVQFVYNKGRVTTAASNRAFKIAAACCRSDILIFLLERADISLEMTFKSALRAKSFDLARLLHKTKRVPLGLLNKVFEETKTVDVVRVLLETKQISAGIIRSTFDNAVDACIHDHCRRGHAKLVAFLCNNEYVSRTAAEHAFTEGVDSGSVLLMKSVCNNRSISPALGAKMLVRAIRKEQFGVVNFLWGQSWIPYEQFAAVFIDAAKHGCLQTVEWFNSYNRASRESITAAFLAAVEEGHIRVARLLLHKQHASPEALNDLIKHASAKHHHHVVAFLLEEKNRRLR